MATKLTPLHDRIVVRRVEEAETTRGGIIIPDSAKDKPQEGEVISVGRGKTNDKGETFPLDVKAGDRVLFGKYAGTEIKIDGDHAGRGSPRHSGRRREAGRCQEVGARCQLPVARSQLNSAELTTNGSPAERPRALSDN